jgi:hypothetical protein
VALTSWVFPWRYLLPTAPALSSGVGSDVLAGLAAREIGRDELVLVVAPGHPWVSRRRHPRAAELAATSLITREPGSGTREAFERALTEHAEGAVALPLLEISSTTAIKAAVVGGWDRSGGAEFVRGRGGVVGGDGYRCPISICGGPCGPCGRPGRTPRGPAGDLLGIAVVRGTA